MELYKHNADTFEAAKSMLESRGRCAIIQAMGTGKTYVLMALLDSLFRGLQVLVVVPAKSEEDAILMYPEWNYTNVTFVTYAGLKTYNKKFDVMVLDELHRAGAPTWLGYVKERIPYVRYCVGMTATPLRYLDGMRDMSVELFDDDVVRGPNFCEAIECGILLGFDYYAILSDVEEYVDNSSVLSAEAKKRVSERFDEYQLVRRIREHITDDRKKWLVFYKDSDSLEQADVELGDWFSGYNLHIYKIYSRQSTAENKRQLNCFNADTGMCVLKVVDMANGSLHIKGVASVILARRTISGNVFLQQLGRGQSASNKKLRPIYIDLVRNFDNLKILSRSLSASGRVVNGVGVRSNIVESTCVYIGYDEVLMDIQEIINKEKCGWSEYDDSVIELYYPLEGSECYRRLSGKTKEQVVRRAKVLGVRRNTRWTKEEDDILRTYYMEERDAIWKRLPGRSQSAILSRAKKLELGVRWELWEDAILYDFYKFEGLLVNQRLNNKTFTDVLERVDKLGMQK